MAFPPTEPELPDSPSMGEEPPSEDAIAPGTGSERVLFAGIALVVIGAFSSALYWGNQENLWALAVAAGLVAVGTSTVAFGAGAKGFVARFLSPLLVAPVVIAAVSFLFTGPGRSAKPFGGIFANSRAIASAKTLVEAGLKAPATAKWQSEEVAWANPPRYIVHLSVDSHNSFGVPIRGHYCVALELADGDKFKYNSEIAVQECRETPSKAEIQLIQTLNAWDAAAP